jgi:hypothetical protein
MAIIAHYSMVQRGPVKPGERLKTPARACPLQRSAGSIARIEAVLAPPPVVPRAIPRRAGDEEIFAAVAMGIFVSRSTPDCVGACPIRANVH